MSKELKGNMIVHPISRKITSDSNFQIFEDWKEVEFIELVEVYEELKDDKAILTGKIKETGKEFKIVMTIEEFFDGKFFELIEEDQEPVQTIEDKKEILNSIELNKEYKVTIFSSKNFQTIEVIGAVELVGKHKILKYHTRNGKETKRIKQIHLNNLVGMSKWIKIEEIKVQTENNIIEILKDKGIEVGTTIELLKLDNIMESLGFDGLGLDFEIEDNAASFYKDDNLFEVGYFIVKRVGSFGDVKIKYFNNL